MENKRNVMHYFYKIWKDGKPYEVTENYGPEIVLEKEPTVLDYANSIGASQVYRYVVFDNGTYEREIVYSGDVEKDLNDVWNSIKNLADIDLDYVLEKLGYAEAEKISIYGLHEYPNLEKYGDIEKLILFLDKYRRTVYAKLNAVDKISDNTK